MIDPSASMAGIVIAVTIALMTGIWVFADARTRGRTRLDASIQAILVAVLLVIFLPLWLIMRPPRLAAASDARAAKTRQAYSLGHLLILIGSLVAAYFFLVFDISVEVSRQTVLGVTVGGQRVANLSLMQQQRNGLLVGLAIAAAGAGLVFLRRSDNSGDTDANTKACPFCAETIKAKATVCRFCGRDLPEA